MKEQPVDVGKVVEKLTARIAQLEVDNAVANVRLDAAHQRIEELENEPETP